MAVKFPTLNYKLPKSVPSYNLASGLGLGLQAITEGYDTAQKQRLADAQLKRLLDKDAQDLTLQQQKLLAELKQYQDRAAERKTAAQARQDEFEAKRADLRAAEENRRTDRETRAEDRQTAAADRRTAEANRQENRQATAEDRRVAAAARLTE